MNDGIRSKPSYDEANGGWTCPSGHAYPKCPGCGHNWFDAKPILLDPGQPVGGWLCHWCIEEQQVEE